DLAAADQPAAGELRRATAGTPAGRDARGPDAGGPAHRDPAALQAVRARPAGAEASGAGRRAAREGRHDASEDGYRQRGAVIGERPEGELHDVRSGLFAP